MLNKTVSLYKNAYTGLTPSSWWLSAVMLINRSGTMVLPFMTLYMLKRGYTIGQAGIVMGLFGMGAVAGGYLGGKLTDHIGYYKSAADNAVGWRRFFYRAGANEYLPAHLHLCLCTRHGK